MQEVYIISAVRTSIGRFRGVLADLSPVDLGAIAMRTALERAKVSAASLAIAITAGLLNNPDIAVSAAAVYSNI
jgi:acetyl-CoA C-acetyltransferase